LDDRPFAGAGTDPAPDAVLGVWESTGSPDALCCSDLPGDSPATVPPTPCFNHSANNRPRLLAIGTHDAPRSRIRDVRGHPSLLGAEPAPRVDENDIPNCSHTKHPGTLDRPM
jgi:hypothetical protein